MDTYRQLVHFWLERASETLKNGGDVLAIIWVFDLLTDFQPHPSFPFADNDGYWFFVGCYLLAGLLHILAIGLEQK